IISYYSTKRIKRLSRATQKVASGNFNVQIEHKDSDEIDQLAENFNKMVQALKQSNEEVKAQEERRDQFMADAAHEMRTPLTTINGILEG
ncbi:HAMP domain-containing protein, partial [Bifidobacterium scardovii]|nr:HAMP domain-containing protein [Bifidobacterium scardovii]